jgi:D-glycero-D-manno-heptose 1,7-bisphosphate phosphatase
MKLIILDRDGVINQDSLLYIKSTDEFILIPGSCEAIARLSAAGYRVAVATNQSGIARGYYNEEELAAIHEKMKAAVAAEGGCIDFVIHCPHMPDVGCSCRKPQPGMLFAVANHFGCSLDQVPFIGDRVSDIQAAEAAGAVPMMVLSSMTDRVGLAAYPDVPIFISLAQCVNALLTTK